MRRVGSGRVPTQEACPCGVGVHQSPTVDEFTPGKPLNPHFGDLMVASLPHFQPLSPLWKMRVWAEYFKLLMMVWSS